MLNRNKPGARKGKVLFIDASGEFEEGSNQNRLRDRDIEHIAGTFHAYADAEKYARVVPLAEIEQNDWNLNISPLCGYLRRGGAYRRRGGGAEAPGAGAGARGGRGDDEPAFGGVGVWRLTAVPTWR